MSQRLFRLSIRLTRVLGVLAGILFLLAAALLYSATDELPWDLLAMGVAFPVCLLWMARVMERNPPQ